jgi:hypothetical protein
MRICPDSAPAKPVDATDLNRQVIKILNYEDHPVASPVYYRYVLLVSHKDSDFENSQNAVLNGTYALPPIFGTYYGSNPNNNNAGISSRVNSGEGITCYRGHGGPTNWEPLKYDVVGVDGMSDPFRPRVEGDRLYGRGAYDMKGALAAMLLTTASMREQDRVRVRLGIVGDEESEVEADRGSDHLVDSGFLGDFAITGEPTDLQIGVEAKGVLALRLEVSGVAAHGATPWLGDNAVLRAHDVFRSIESLPFARQSSELFDRPSINLGRILGGDALNKVPDRCAIDVDIRYLPEQDPKVILEQVRAIDAEIEVQTLFSRPPAVVDRNSVFVRALREAAERELAHRERRRLGVALDTGGGPGEHHAAVLLRQHALDRLLTDQEAAEGGGHQGFLDLGRIELGDRPAGAIARVVDHDLRRTE